MKHFLLLFCLALAACAAGPTKRLTTGPTSASPLSALHIAGETPVSRTVVQIVSDASGFGLSVHVGRSDGPWPSVDRALIDGERLGGTLVAPVVAYVPEGATGETPTDHMRWPGTLSVPEEVFAAVLEHTARSLATHGFTRILFVGDSLLNQLPQAEVAARLSEEWRGRGLTVLHVGDYYAANGQVEALMSDGFGEAEIGNHAGLRDTSELMAVSPAAVRADPVAPPTGAAGGFDGRPDMATPELGHRLLELKIDAALRQIRAARRPSG
jgi:creatinine amidohydrolase/Fe(II)-dependent formamide hydrolase-like protein